MITIDEMKQKKKTDYIRKWMNCALKGIVFIAAKVNIALEQIMT